MSQITKALKKVQTSREGLVEKIYSTDHTEHNVFRPWSNVLPLAGMISAFMICFIIFSKVEFNKNAVSDLAATLEIQQKKIDRLNLLLESNKKHSDAQMNNLDARLAQLSKDYRIKVYSLGVSSRNQYDQLHDQLQEAMAENKQQVIVLTKDIKSLNKKINEISVVSQNQAKEVQNP